MNILVYYPSNSRTIAIESVILKFKEAGHSLFLLTQTPEGDLHTALEKQGVQTAAAVIPKKAAPVYYLRHILFLRRYIAANKIDIVYSHLQQANIISVFTQYISAARFYICRHHADRAGASRNFNQDLFDKLINRLAKLIIVPSRKVYQQVTEAEGTNPAKVKLIHYGYDFSKYPLPDAAEVAKIKSDHPAKLLLVKIARLVPGKRYPVLFGVIRELVLNDKLDIRLIAISDGPLMDEYSQWIVANGMQKNIFLLGNRTNVIDYLQAADAVPLLSESEASNNVIKEAALLRKCVLVCDDVGDFNDYIEQGKSGLLLGKTDPATDLKKYLIDLYSGKTDRETMGQRIHDNVLALFSIDNVINEYRDLNKP